MKLFTSVLSRLFNIPFWLANRLPGSWVLDRNEGIIRAKKLSPPTYLLQFRESPWLVSSGKSSDWSQGMTEILESPFFRMHKPDPGESVMSVGAGIGTEALLAARMVGDSGSVAAMEPDPTAFNQLCLSLASQSIRNVFAIQAAASSENGWVNLSLGALSDRDFTTSHLRDYSASGASGKDLMVRSLRISDVQEMLGWESIDLLLMNIEGAEFDALQGIKVLPRRIVVSCHDFLGVPRMRTFESCSFWLKERGYRISSFEPNPNRPWEEFYIFAARDNH